MQNPFANVIKVKLQKAANNISLQLFNINGSMVGEKIFFNARQLNWDMPNTLNSGIYILRAVVDGELFSKKIIKE